MPKLFKNLKNKMKRNMDASMTTYIKDMYWKKDISLVVYASYHPATGDVDEMFAKYVYLVNDEIQLHKELDIASYVTMKFTSNDDLRLPISWLVDNHPETSEEFTIPKHQLIGYDLGGCVLESKDQADSLVSNLTVELRDDHDKGILVLQPRGIDLSSGQREKINPYLEIYETFFMHAEHPLARTNCVYGGKGKVIKSVVWNQLLLSPDDHFKIQSKQIDFRVLQWSKSNKSSCGIGKCHFKGQMFVNNPGTIQKVTAEIVSQKKKSRGMMEVTFLYDAEFPTLLQYRKGGFSIKVDVHGDHKAQKSHMDTVLGNVNRVLDNWMSPDSELHNFRAEGVNFSSLLDCFMKRAKKITPGMGYLVFIFFAGSSDHTDIKTDQVLRSSHLPLSVIVMAADKEASGKWLFLEKIKEGMFEIKTDFIKKKNKQRNNFDWYKYPSGSESEFLKEWGTKSPLNRLSQHITEYLYVNGVFPCQQAEPLWHTYQCYQNF